MASSYNKDRVYWIVINRAPAHLSYQDWKGELEYSMTHWLDIPLVQDTTVKFENIAANIVLDDPAKAWGSPMTRAIPSNVFLMEYKSRDDMVKSANDPLVQSTLSTFPESNPDRRATVFVGEAKTIIDKKASSNIRNNVHYFDICEVPTGGVPEECEKKLDVLVERFTSLPIAQKSLLKYTMYRQDSSMDAINTTQLKVHHGPEYTFIFHKEFENEDDMIETAVMRISWSRAPNFSISHRLRRTSA
ncbi:hypothetical protein FB45DRAFT_1004312 [Roridomyces roridus]|uniref:Uncharacterized protein n=1 Tax=Roridomyces roridus TaxID=1738132 RepID=A0AAD7BS82_9AGAR|nr:hypothetical protein FB45DRAFT_1004312 [Roridomyces roridus]